MIYRSSCSSFSQNLTYFDQIFQMSKTALICSSLQSSQLLELNNESVCSDQLHHIHLRITFLTSTSLSLSLYLFLLPLILCLYASLFYVLSLSLSLSLASLPLFFNVSLFLFVSLSTVPSVCPHLSLCLSHFSFHPFLYYYHT